MSSFWDRRRAGIEAEARTEALAEAATAKAARDAALAEKTDEELLAELNLPDPETMGPQDDFKAFLTDTVPARLRARALRRLWRVNPVLANLDGLVDYGEDYTDAATVVENLQTAYQVGKGMRAHVEEMARQAEAADAAELAGEAEPDPREEDLVDASGLDETDATAAADAPPADDALPVMTARSVPEEDVAPMPAARRRMQFTFDSKEVT